MRSGHLKTHGWIWLTRARPALCDVTQATLVAQLLYASPAWSGFLKVVEKAKLQSILNKAVRYGFLPVSYKLVDELFESSDNTLFSAILRRSHRVLHPLLHPLKTTVYHLRKRSRGLHLRCSQIFRGKILYTECCTLTLIMRPSSLGGGRILRRTLSVRLSVCPSVCPSASVRPSRYHYRASRGAT